MGNIISLDKSIIPACDVPFEQFLEIVEATHDIDKVGAYKIGVSFLDIGLEQVVASAREFTSKPIFMTIKRQAALELVNQL